MVVGIHCMSPNWMIGFFFFLLKYVGEKKKENLYSRFVEFMQCLFDISGVHFQKALFVPNISVYNKVGTYGLPSTDSQVDLSWQMTIQRVWENLVHGDKGITISY